MNIKKTLLLVALVLITAWSVNPVKTTISENHQKTSSAGPNLTVEKTKFTLPKSGVPVLMYHSIANDKGNDAVISPAQFTSEMNLLKANNFHTITLDQLYNYLTARKPLPENPVMLTFDDGYADNYTNVLPIVRRLKLHAVLFMITGKADTGGYYLNWQQLREMSEAGFEINSHTVTHPRLPNLTMDKQKQELVASRAAIKNKLNLTANYFCYPYGRYNAQTIKLLQATGYRLAFIMQPDLKKAVPVQPGINLLALPRIYIGPNTTSTEFIEKISQ